MRKHRANKQPKSEKHKMSRAIHRPVMGRPPKPKGKKQSERIAVNVTPAEYRAIEADAKAEGVSLSAYLLKCWKKRRNHQ